MPINRAPFNSLVDDDGSGLVGTVWNKTAIQYVLLDPIDENPTFQNVPFDAANFSASAPMTWTVGAAAVLSNRYAIIGHLMVWTIFLSWFSGANALGGTASNNLLLKLPGGKLASNAGNFLLVDMCGGITGAASHGGLRAEPSGANLKLVKPDSSNFSLADTPGIVCTFVIEV